LATTRKKIMSQPNASATSTTDDNQIEITVEGEQKFHNVELNDAETKSEEANSAFNKAFYSLNEAISKLHEKHKGDVVPTITTNWDIVHAVVSRELRIQQPIKQPEEEKRLSKCGDAAQITFHIISFLIIVVFLLIICGICIPLSFVCLEFAAASKLFQVTFAHDNTTASFETIELGRAWSGYFSVTLATVFGSMGVVYMFVDLFKFPYRKLE
jgi:hypothetical protein